MTLIDPGAKLTAALQAQLAAPRERARTQAAAPAARSAPASRHAAETVAGRMVQRLATIDREDPQRRQKAVRIYLEGELVREFGDRLLNDPQFPVLLDAVQQGMGHDAQTAAAVHALGDLLLATPA